MVEQLKLIQCPHCGEKIDLSKDGPVWVDIGLMEPIKCVDMQSAKSLVRSCKGRILEGGELNGRGQ